MRTGPQRAGSRARKCARRAFSSPHTFACVALHRFFCFFVGDLDRSSHSIWEEEASRVRHTRTCCSQGAGGHDVRECFVCHADAQQRSRARVRSPGCIAKPPLRWSSWPVAPMRKRQCTGRLSRAHAGRESRPHTLSTTHAQVLQRSAAHSPALLTPRSAWLLCRCSRTCVRCISLHKVSRATVCLRYQGFALCPCREPERVFLSQCHSPKRDLRPCPMPVFSVSASTAGHGTQHAHARVRTHPSAHSCN